MNEKDNQEEIWQAVFEERFIHAYDKWMLPKAGFVDEYSKGCATAIVACPICFYPITISDSTCPNCGINIQKDMLNVIRENAFELAAFAWDYRQSFEHTFADKQDNKKNLRFYLNPPEGWVIYFGINCISWYFRWIKL